MSDFTRKELCEIKGRALEGRDSVLNPFWKKAYEDIAYAADRLDAMMARTSNMPEDMPVASASEDAGSYLHP